jgi:hypothetical protein
VHAHAVEPLEAEGRIDGYQSGRGGTTGCPLKTNWTRLATPSSRGPECRLRTGHADHYYARWAQAYVEACQTTRTPFLTMAKRFPPNTAAQLRRVVTTARRRKLLLGRTPGRPGGRLSAKPERLLATTATKKGRTK